MGIPYADIFDTVPSYTNRKKIIARDPLAAVEGFRAIVMAACIHIFGIAKMILEG